MALIVTTDWVFRWRESTINAGMKATPGPKGHHRAFVEDRGSLRVSTDPPGDLTAPRRRSPARFDRPEHFNES